MTAAKRRIPSRTGWVLAVVAALVVIVAVATGTFWSLLATFGVLGLVLGLIALLRKSSRKRGFVAVLVSLSLVVVGSGMNSTMDPPDSDVASLVSAPSASSTPTPTATTKPTPTPTPTPKATQAEVQEASVIPYAAVSVNDDTIDVGATAITVGGANGEKVTTYLVQYLDGVEVSRAVAREETTVAPVDEVTAIGTRAPAPVVAPEPEPAPAADGCDPNYEGSCVPIASDVDCAGGSGDGPGYAEGPVRIVGTDIYDLDRDGDGIACDS